ncbi:hypothetical protein [Variovorax sp. PAMC26660]|uniref:hypothetical protein n=1 Tax=Variovorax sp. PAMC26660 TaxID=2762322 RepID=UPI00164E7FF3|nr:hypothetical protein [Variovorax sp. PAMC26660]QNK70561.1 hypothetical protein H7F35_13145 [Variovorax sp. PAMC26660]
MLLSTATFPFPRSANGCQELPQLRFSVRGNDTSETSICEFAELRSKKTLRDNTLGETNGVRSLRVIGVSLVFAVVVD